MTLEQRISLLEKKIGIKESTQKVDGNRIKVYDDGGETLDRYTIVFLDFERERNGNYQAIGASQTGGGFYQHVSAKLGRHLGKEIKFSDLDSRLQSLIKQEFED